MNFLASTAVIDDYTVQLKTKTPFGPLLQSIGYQGAHIGSPAVSRVWPSRNVGRNPVGTGPWSFGGVGVWRSHHLCRER